MSYLNPQSWTDDDFAGNPLNWSSREHKQTYPGYEMLRKALVERCTATSTAVPAILNTARAPGRIYSGDWFASFHATVSTLIPKFLNYTDNGGDWDGETGVGPVWNEADILAEIGDASRVAAPDIPLAAWSLQQYKILNELLWTVVAVLPQVVDQLGKGSVTPGVSWAQATADYLAASWFSPGGHFIEAFGRNGILNLKWERARYKGKLQAVIPTDIYAATIDWYAYMTRITEFGSTWYWDNDGFPMSENKVWRFHDGDGPASDTTRVSDFLGDKDGLPPTPPFLYPPTTTIAGWLWRYASSRAVVKWDVTGGFAFVP